VTRHTNSTFVPATALSYPAVPRLPSSLETPPHTPSPVPSSAQQESLGEPKAKRSWLHRVSAASSISTNNRRSTGRQSSSMGGRTPTTVQQQQGLLSPALPRVHISAAARLSSVGAGTRAEAGGREGEGEMKGQGHAQPP
jgi:hypothetical protein